MSPASSCVEMDRFNVSSTKTTRALTALLNCLLESVRICRLKVARLANCLVSVLAVVRLCHREGVEKQPKGVTSSQMGYGDGFWQNVEGRKLYGRRPHTGASPHADVMEAPSHANSMEALLKFLAFWCEAGEAARAEVHTPLFLFLLASYRRLRGRSLTESREATWYVAGISPYRQGLKSQGRTIGTAGSVEKGHLQFREAYCGQ